MNIKGFEFIEIIGKGSAGAVYKAYETALERYVAIKILHPELNNNDVIIKRFINEAKTAASLIHPNIINIFSIKQENDINCIIMEYHNGKNLAEILKENTKLPLSKANEIFLQCLNGITFAHDKGILHRDIKPENIIYSEKTNTVKIVDFGLAKILDSQKNLTLSGKLIGTPCYMSPEQIKGLPLDAKSDLYSLGVLYFHLVTGKLPYDSENISGYIYKTLHENVPSVKNLEPDISNELNDVIYNLMNKIPENRFKNGHEVQNIILQYFNSKKENSTKEKVLIRDNKFNLFKFSKIILLLSLFLFSIFFLINLKNKSQQIKVYKNNVNAWTLSVDDKPYFIKGINFNPLKITSKDNTDFFDSWFFYDENKNNKNDVAYESWIDENNNGIKDKNEDEQGDFKMLKDAGINTIKVSFIPPSISNNDELLLFNDKLDQIKSLFRDLFKNYQIMVIFNYSFNVNGFKTIEDCEKKNSDALNLMLSSFKKEKFLLFFMIDIPIFENEYFSKENPDLILKIIKKINENDKTRPVAITMKTNNINFYTNIHQSGLNVIYGFETDMGDEGFYDLWSKCKPFNKPILISGFGIGSYNLKKNSSDETLQANYLIGAWSDIILNSFLSYPKNGEGNAIGGIINEWLDSWNKDSNPLEHNTGYEKNNITPDNIMHKEWMGLIANEYGTNSPFLRKPKKAYYIIKDVFSN